MQNGYVEVEVTEKAENSTIRKLNQAVSDVQVISCYNNYYYFLYSTIACRCNS
jgi:hypothetical protein